MDTASVRRDQLYAINVGYVVQQKSAINVWSIASTSDVSTDTELLVLPTVLCPSLVQAIQRDD